MFCTDDEGLWGRALDLQVVANSWDDGERAAFKTKVASVARLRKRGAKGRCPEMPGRRSERCWRAADGVVSGRPWRFGAECMQQQPCCRAPAQAAATANATATATARGTRGRREGQPECKQAGTWAGSS